MEKVTYIIPIHQYDETVEKYLTRALNSLKQLVGAETFKTLFVGEKETVHQCESLYKKLEVPQKIDVLETNETDIFAKINLAASKCVTSYFSVLEFDDEFYEYWNDVAQKVIEKHRYSVILPINELINEKRDGITLMNEIAWDAAFSDELGFIGVEELKTFKDFITSGGYIKTDDFISCGMLKPSMKIAAWYELLLRMANNGYKIYIAPRVGYKHTILRDGSYMLETQKTLSIEEGKWLIQYAGEEYVNKADANKTFEVNSEKADN